MDFIIIDSKQLTIDHIKIFIEKYINYIIDNINPVKQTINKRL